MLSLLTAEHSVEKDQYFSRDAIKAPKNWSWVDKDIKNNYKLQHRIKPWTDS